MRRAERSARPADDIEDLAKRVDRLTVSHRDPESFHIERSEIVGDMRRLADEVRRSLRDRPT